MSESAAERVASEMNDLAKSAMRQDDFDKARFFVGIEVLARLLIVQEERIKELEREARYREELRESRD